MGLLQSLGCGAEIGGLTRPVPGVGRRAHRGKDRPAGVRGQIGGPRDGLVEVRVVERSRDFACRAWASLCIVVPRRVPPASRESTAGREGVRPVGEEAGAGEGKEEEEEGGGKGGGQGGCRAPAGAGWALGTRRQAWNRWCGPLRVAEQ